MVPGMIVSQRSDFMFQKSKQLSEAEQKWDRMIELWGQGNLESPYAELLEYDSEVNNGGHSQYFFNVANCGDLHAAVTTILAMLPPVHCDNLKRGYDAFSAQNDICDDDNEDLFDACDNVFYEHEQSILDILETYASNLDL